MGYEPKDAQSSQKIQEKRYLERLLHIDAKASRKVFQQISSERPQCHYNIFQSYDFFKKLTIAMKKRKTYLWDEELTEEGKPYL